MSSQDEQAVHVRAFLIADMRGYTSFTQRRGDEAAAALAASFEELTREVAESFGGQLVEARGDEALTVFTSARGALRAAVEMQSRLAERAHTDPDETLPAGIGIDAGESVPVGDGYRGGALNIAARLCSLAGPGEILATEVVTHFAGRIEGIVYARRGEQPLKGIDEPVRVVVVQRAGGELLPMRREPQRLQRRVPEHIPFEDVVEAYAQRLNERIRFNLESKLGELERHDLGRTVPAPPLPSHRRGMSGTEAAVALAGLVAAVIIVIAVIVAIVIVIR